MFYLSTNVTEACRSSGTDKVRGLQDLSQPGINKTAASLLNPAALVFMQHNTINSRAGARAALLSCTICPFKLQKSSN